MHTQKDRYMLRLPNGWRDAIKSEAARNRRSMNNEILDAVEVAFAAKQVALPQQSAS